MTWTFAGPGIKATEAASSPAGMPPYPTPSPLKLSTLSRILARLVNSSRAERPPFLVSSWGEPCAEWRTGGRSPQGVGGLQAPRLGAP